MLIVVGIVMNIIVYVIVYIVRHGVYVCRRIVRVRCGIARVNSRITGINISRIIGIGSSICRRIARIQQGRRIARIGHCCSIARIRIGRLRSGSIVDCRVISITIINCDRRID